jgi:hypothetical protein
VVVLVVVVVVVVTTTTPAPFAFAFACLRAVFASRFRPFLLALDFPASFKTAAAAVAAPGCFPPVSSVGVLALEPSEPSPVYRPDGGWVTAVGL